MALDRQKEAAEKRGTQQQQQQNKAEGLVPRMKVSSSLTIIQANNEDSLLRLGEQILFKMKFLFFDLTWKFVKFDHEN